MTVLGYVLISEVYEEDDDADVTPSLHSGIDEIGIWFYYHREEGKTARRIIPWSQIKWVDTE